MTRIQGQFSSIIAQPDNRLWSGDVSNLSSRPHPGSPNFLAWNEGRAWYLRSLCSTSQTKYFIDPVSGSDAKDGLDSFPATATTGFTWTESTKTLSKVGGFTGSTWFKGAQKYISGGTGATPGLYTVASKTSNNAIVLETSIGAAADGQTNITCSNGPKQTGTAVNTLLAAGNCRLMARRGTRMSFAAGLVHSAGNVSYGTYGTGPDFIVDTNPTVQATGAAFTLTATKTYTYQMARSGASVVAGVREQGRKGEWYARVSSTAECEALPGSYYHDTGGNLLHIHHYYNQDMTNGTTPTNMEIYTEVVVNGLKVENSVNSNVIMEGWKFIGHGASVAASQNSCYGIHVQLSGSNVFCMVGGGAELNNNHNIGLEQGSGPGGILVCFGVEAGGLTFIGDPYVCYAGVGGQEMYLVDCEVLCGNILRISGGVPNFSWGTSQVGFGLMHTDGAGGHYSAYGVNIRGKVRRGPMQAGGLFAIADTVPTTNDPTAIKGWNIDCEFQSWHPSAKDNTILPDANYGMGKSPYQIGGGNPVDGFTTGYINTFFEGRLQKAGVLNDMLWCIDALAGLHLNSTFDFDLSQVQSGDRNTASAAIVQAATSLTGSLHNCHVRIRGAGSQRSGQGVGFVGFNLYANNSRNFADENPQKFSMHDTIVTIEPEQPSQAFLACGNNRQNGSAIGDAGGAKWNPSRMSNIVTNVPYSTDVYRGNDQIDNVIFVPGWKIGRRPKTGEIDAVQKAIMGSAYYLGYDKEWRPRRSGTTAIGPLEAIA